MPADLKIGLTCWKAAGEWNAKTLCEQATATESMGFHSYWLPENHFGSRAMPSPLTQLAAVAACTSSIRLGTVSYLLPIRHPIQAAEEVAVVDQLCQGRLILGLGRGIQQELFRAFAIESRDKRKLFARNLQAMQQAWSGKQIGEDGPLLSPLPYQTGGPPLWVAAFGPLALKQAAQLGLPYLASPMEDIESLETNYAQYNALRAEGQMPPADVVPVMRTVFIHRDKNLRNQLAQALDKQAHAFRGGNGGDIHSWTLIGESGYVRDKLAEYRERLGMTHLIASGRLPALSAQTVLDSHKLLATVGS